MKNPFINTCTLLSFVIDQAVDKAGVIPFFTHTPSRRTPEIPYPLELYFNVLPLEYSNLL